MFPGLFCNKSEVECFHFVKKQSTLNYIKYTKLASSKLKHSCKEVQLS